MRIAAPFVSFRTFHTSFSVPMELYSSHSINCLDQNLRRLTIWPCISIQIRRKGYPLCGASFDKAILINDGEIKQDGV
jgi:hypothetical protein